MGSGLGFLGHLVDPTNEYKSEAHKIFSKCLVYLITLVVGNVTTMAFVILGLLILNGTLSFTEDEWSVSSCVIATLGLWSIVEVIFYIYCLVLRQKLDVPMTLPSMTAAEKEIFLSRVLKQCHDPLSTLVKWFYLHPEEDIGVECMTAWLSWALFGRLHQDLNSMERDELKILVDQVVEKCPQIGRPSAQRPLNFMQLHLDKMVVQHKPFVAYAVISVMQVMGSLFLSHLGFEHQKVSRGSKLSYWTYGPPCTKSTTSKEPIFIVHGIGIGIAMYFKLVKSVVSQFPQRQIFILELPHISLKVIDRIPSIEETLDAVDEIFHENNIKSCSWLAHSYGTIVTTWILKERPNYVKRVTLVDPVCFALWEPDLIYNFLYKRPLTSIHRLCQFFVSQDLVVASTLFRNFSWLQNILFPEDIHCPAHSFISSHDFIIDPEKICQYLELHNEQVNTSRGQGRRIGVTKMIGLAHGSILNSSKYITDVLSHV